MFHVAKHAIKFVGFTHDYDICSVPIDERGIMNDLLLKLKGLDIQEKQLENILFFAPNLNSIRRLKVSQFDK